MKIFQTKISNPIAYLLIVFIIASVALAFYGQFSNVEINTIDTVDVSVPTPRVDTNVESTSTPEENAVVSDVETVAPEVTPDAPVEEVVAPEVTPVVQ